MESFRKRGAAIVTTGKHLFPSLAVEIDNELDATDYLISLGHKSIAYISGPDQLTTSESRLNGYLASLKSHNLAVDPSLILPGQYTYASGIAADQSMLAFPQRPTAVLASNDMVAIGCMVGLKEAGLCIPENMSLMGIDDITPALFVDPSLSTVKLPLYEQGAIGMEYLVKLYSEEVSPSEIIMLPYQLVIRNSTKALDN